MKAVLAAALACALLAGCGGMARRAPDMERDSSATPQKPAATANAPRPPLRGGGYYQDDGPGDKPPANLDQIADAEPKAEPLRRAANNPYVVLGQQYMPLKVLAPFKQRGVGSWYGRKFHGQRTSSGEIYDMYAMTAAHPTLPIPSYARVTNLANGKSVIVRVNDRGPFLSARVIDLSYTAAYKLGYAGAGSARVEVETIMPEDMPLLAARRRQAQPVMQAAAPPEPAAPPAGEQSDPIAALAAAEVNPVTPAASIEARPLEAEPPRQSIPVDSEAGGIFLQLGAFSGRDNAESFRSRVYQQLAWLNDSIQIYSRDGMFRLHLGPYRDRGEAASMADRIREALQVKPVVVVR